MPVEAIQNKERRHQTETEQVKDDGIGEDIVEEFFAPAKRRIQPPLHLNVAPGEQITRPVELVIVQAFQAGQHRVDGNKQLRQTKTVFGIKQIKLVHIADL